MRYLLMLTFFLSGCEDPCGKTANWASVMHDNSLSYVVGGDCIGKIESSAHVGIFNKSKSDFGFINNIKYVFGEKILIVNDQGKIVAINYDKQVTDVNELDLNFHITDLDSSMIVGNDGWIMNEGFDCIKLDNITRDNLWSIDYDGDDEVGYKQSWTVVGENGLILRVRRDPGQCMLSVTRELAATGVTFRKVFGANSNGKWIVGDSGVILNRLGDGRWSRINSGTSSDLYNGLQLPNDEVIAIGDKGVMVNINHDNSYNSEVIYFDKNAAKLLGIALNPHTPEVLIVGERGTLFKYYTFYNKVFMSNSGEALWFIGEGGILIANHESFKSALYNILGLVGNGSGWNKYPYFNVFEYNDQKLLIYYENVIDDENCRVFNLVGNYWNEIIDSDLCKQTIRGSGPHGVWGVKYNSGGRFELGTWAGKWNPVFTLGDGKIGEIKKKDRTELWFSFEKKIRIFTLKEGSLSENNEKIDLPFEFDDICINDFWGNDDNVWVIGTPKCAEVSSPPFRPAKVAQYNYKTKRWIQVTELQGARQGRRIWGTGSDDVWFLADERAVYHWDGINLVAIDISDDSPLRKMHWTNDSYDGVQAIGARKPHELWLAGVGTPLRREWPYLRAAWGSQKNDIWAAGDGGYIRHWDGAAWSKPPVPPRSLPTENLRSVWGSGKDDVWFVGDAETVLHWDGTTLKPSPDIPNPQRKNLSSVWALTTNNKTTVWAVGQSGTVLVREEGLWRRMQAGTADLSAIWGSATTDLWLLSAGALLRWDGTNPPSKVPCPTTALKLTSLWGKDANDVWAVGDKGLVVHWDGATCQQLQIGTDKNLNVVWGDQQGVYTAGLDVMLRRFPDGSWRHDMRPTIHNRNALWSSGGDDLWVIGGGMENIGR